MATSITLRSTKGSALTHAEVDSNFSNLKTTADAAVPAGAVTSSGLTMATNRLLGRTTASTGAVQEIIAGAGLSLSSGQLEVNFTGYLTTADAATTYQPLNGSLTSIGGLSGTTGLLKKTAANTYTLDTNTYLTTGDASSTYLTQSNAASTYQTQSSMSSYLTTATASSTYQTQAGMSAYLSTATAATTYQPLDPDITAIAGISSTGLLRRTAADTWSVVSEPAGSLVGTTATQTLTNKTLTSPTLDGSPYVNGSYRSNIVAVSALDIDCSAGNYFTKTINANSTFTFSNVPASRAYSFTLELTHTSGTVTWPTEVKWPDDTAPTLTTGKTHIFVFVTDDGGTRWRGAALVNYVN